MNIKVDTEYLAALNQIRDAFGLPAPRDKYHDELFGPYHVSSGDGYLFYDSQRREMTYKSIRRPSISLAPFDAIMPEDLNEIAETMEFVRELAPVSAPFDTKCNTLSRPFKFEKWLFGWVFVPELRRWELAPLGYA